MKKTPLAAPWRCVAGSLTLALAITASPQVMAQDDSEEDTADVGRVTVTGSRIKRVDIEGPAPVVIITAEEMEQKGFSQVSEVLDSLVQNTGGTADQSFTFGFVPATSAPDLRGFGQNGTLVLIDGRRIPVYPIPQSGVSNIVDFANIPTVQIDRIEILTDGASAIYGSDAIAGVINIITRKDFEGVNLDVRLGDTADGGYQTERVQLFAGTGAGDTRISGTFEYWHNDPIWARDRDYAGSDVANPRGAYSVGGATFVDLFTDNQFLFQAPGCGTPDGPLGGLGIPDQNVPIFTGGDVWCAFNRTAYRQLFAEQKRTSASTYIEHDLANEVTAFFRAGYTDQRTNWQLEPNFYGAFVFGTTPADDDRVLTPLTQPDWGWVPGGQANNYAPEGNPGVFVRRLNNGLQALAGLKGTFGSRNIYDWDVGIAYNKIDISVLRPNIISSTFNEAVSNGLDLFQPIPQSVVETTSFLASRNSESTNTTIDGTISGDTGLELPGGPLAFAVHADFTDEEFSNVPDAISLNGDAFDGGSAGSGERKHYGLGVELGIPVLATVNVSAALRYDDYDDLSTTGDATSPKIGIEWRPIRDLLVRGGWGESFRAPDMQRLFGATTNAFTTVNDPVTGLQVQSVAIRSGSNPNLVPEEGENWNVGVVWDAFEGFTVSLDWVSIELEQIVTTLSAQSILNLCGPNQDGPTCGNVTRDAQGTLQGGFISQQASNLSLQSYEGLDFRFRYTLDTARAGTFTTELAGAYVDTLETQTTSTSEVVENIGFATLPELRANLDFLYEIGDFSARLFVIWVDEMCGVNGGTAPGATTCEPEEFIDDYMLTNLNASYDLGDWGRFSLGINNVFDEDPADDPTNNQWPWFFNNGGFSNPIGREITLAWNKQF